jgi:hypothetical protein
VGGFSVEKFGESFNGLLANECGFSDSFSSGSFNTCTEEVAEQAPAGTGGSGRRYRAPAWWGDEPKKKKAVERVELQIAAVQKKITELRVSVDHTYDLERMQRLIEKIAALQVKLLALLAKVDQIRKGEDEEMAMVLVAVSRMFH